MNSRARILENALPPKNSNGKPTELQGRTRTLDTSRAETKNVRERVNEREFRLINRLRRTICMCHTKSYVRRVRFVEN